MPYIPCIILQVNDIKTLISVLYTKISLFFVFFSYAASCVMCCVSDRSSVSGELCLFQMARNETFMCNYVVFVISPSNPYLPNSFSRKKSFDSIQLHYSGTVFTSLSGPPACPLRTVVYIAYIVPER